MPPPMMITSYFVLFGVSVLMGMSLAVWLFALARSFRRFDCARKLCKHEKHCKERARPWHLRYEALKLK